jgi:hypothetical protein
MTTPELTYTSDQKNPNWFYQKYYFAGANARYYTFQLALNILNQTRPSPIIVETGCQRQKDDLGAGMSTSIFGEYVNRYGGKLVTVDLMPQHLTICKECTAEWSSHIQYVESDSLVFLKNYRGRLDLVYLDSLDYPIGDDAENIRMRDAAQNHNLLEFRAIENVAVMNKSLVLLDDNTLPYGGKPKLCKDYLSSRGWICLLDSQQSLWMLGV